MAKIILKNTDVQEYRDISANYKQERFDSFALEVQETQLRELLGDGLYYALVNDLDANGEPQTQKYTDLVDGKEYVYDNETIFYFGIKPFLSYHWLALNMREGNVRQADYGNVVFDDNPQDNMVSVSQKQIDRVNAHLMTNVTSYRNNIVRFLNENDSEYEQWDGKTDTKSKSQFNSFTI